MTNDVIPLPFWELPFDANVGQIQMGTLTLDQITSIEHIVKFGRPLWSTRYSSSNTVAKDGIIKFALIKLRNFTKVTKAHEIEGVIEIPAKQRHAHLAALGVCVLFEFERVHAAQKLQMDLIASNMRIVWSMNDRREYVVGGYPCEPILAVAALHHLHEVNQEGERYHCLSVMRDAVVESHISKGEGGELVARLILILAFHSTLFFPVAPSREYPAMQIPYVPVCEFLRKLLPTKSDFDQFLKMGPHGGGAPAETVFENAKVYFTHFVRWAETPDAQDLWTAVVRGHAIQCMPQQEAVDIIIPIILDPTARLTDKHMSAILIQVRNRTRRASGYPDGKKMKLFATKETPYIAIIFQLGMNDKVVIPKSSTHPMELRPETTPDMNDKVAIPKSPSHSMELRRGTTPGKPKKPKKPKTPTSGGQYCIDIQGCSSKSFGVINPDEDKLFKEMLTSQDIVECHPRQSKGHINAVAALKPYWKHSNSIPPRVDPPPCKVTKRCAPSNAIPRLRGKDVDVP